MDFDGVFNERLDQLHAKKPLPHVQPISYPTVPRGAERLRLTPTPQHSDDDIDALVAALRSVWDRHCEGLTAAA
jgi:5-aminolevulinate synthase